MGDPDPVQAAQDALLKAPADEVLIFEHCDEQSKWYEEGLLEKAQEGIEPPLRVIVVETGDDEHADHVVDVEETGQGTVNPLADKEIGGGAYVPGMTRSDFAGIVAGIVGTIVVAVLAAAVTGRQRHRDRLGSGGGPDRDRHRPRQPRPRGRHHASSRRSITGAASPSSSAPWP